MPYELGQIPLASDIAASQLQAAQNVLQAFFGENFDCTPERTLAAAQLIAVNLAALSAVGTVE